MEGILIALGWLVRSLLYKKSHLIYDVGKVVAV